MLNSAALCRRRGWSAGTKLAGRKSWAHQAGPTDYCVITAIGEQLILARRVNADGTKAAGYECIWHLHGLQWRAVEQPEQETPCET